MEKQFVIFEIGHEQFGIEIASVEAIVKMQEITQIPYAPTYMEGITNLRGSILPVIDLSKRFNLDQQQETSETRIIVAILENLKVGMVVCAVNEVLSIDEDQIEPPPAMMNSAATGFITGIAKTNSRLMILLDMVKVLSQNEQLELEKTMKKVK